MLLFITVFVNIEKKATKINAWGKYIKNSENILNLKKCFLSIFAKLSSRWSACWSRGFLIENNVVKNIKNKSWLIMKKLSSTTNLFSDKIGKTNTRTAMVGVIKNKDVLFRYSLSSSFLIIKLLLNI